MFLELSRSELTSPVLVLGSCQARPVGPASQELETVAQLLGFSKPRLHDGGSNRQSQETSTRKAPRTCLLCAGVCAGVPQTVGPGPPTAWLKTTEIHCPSLEDTEPHFLGKNPSLPLLLSGSFPSVLQLCL